MENYTTTTRTDQYGNEYSPAELVEIIISNDKDIYDQASNSAYLLSGISDEGKWVTAFTREAHDLLTLYGDKLRNSWSWAYVSESDVIDGFRLFLETCDL